MRTTTTPSPRDVFDHPDHHWAFLTVSRDEEFEGQHFDRKEAGQIDAGGGTSKSQLDNVREEVIDTVSAFANANVEGGLLVLGISTSGVIKGVDHLNENQLASLTNLNNLLTGQSVDVKLVGCTDQTGKSNHITLIYVHHSARSVCQTLHKSPRSWTRSARSNLPLSQQGLDQLRVKKRIVDFENAACCEYDPAEVSEDIFEQFRRCHVPDGARRFTQDQLLYEVGALTRQDGKQWFTNAGLLFFAANPQRVLPWAFVRLLRFEGDFQPPRGRGLQASLDRPFSGPLCKQIMDLRAFFRESGFFHTYTRRTPEGALARIPEYPAIAIDEAIVNAVTHRDYAIKLPIECERYTDAFMVRNPGRLMQRDQDMPDEFALDSTTLDSTPRNPKLLEWLKCIRDSEDRPFVLALSEGTRSMQAELAKLGLPPAAFRLTESQTCLRFVGDTALRQNTSASGTAPTTEFANLYAVTAQRDNRTVTTEQIGESYRNIVSTLRDRLSASGWYIDDFSFGQMIVHRRGQPLVVPPAASTYLRIFPAYDLRLRRVGASWYLAVDYTVEVLNVSKLNQLIQVLGAEPLRGRRCIVELNGWQDGEVLTTDEEWTTVRLADQEQEVRVPSGTVIPRLPLRLIEQLLQHKRVRFDLQHAVKGHSLCGQPGMARERADRIQSVAEYFADQVFPLRVGDMQVGLNRTPAPLYDGDPPGGRGLRVFRLQEPAVEFADRRATPDVREGITRFGAYEEDVHEIELVPLCERGHRVAMQQLIERLRTGKYKYRGSERTFRTRFRYSTVITYERPEDAKAELDRLLVEQPDWAGNSQLDRVILAHTPEEGYGLDDVSSPYFVLKRKLLESGVPCQMVDTPTLANPDWKDLNLCLNIVAKCGVTPWVLPNAVPDADFFVGLSHTRSPDGRRVIGYANVFNQYGRWEFYSGKTGPFDYEQRLHFFGQLVRETLTKLSLSHTPNIVFHSSEKLSREGRDLMSRAAREIRPEGTFTFVWVNSHHGYRVFDRRPESDGSLSRGSYVALDRNRFLMSTTGYNPYRKALGTPKPLEVTAWVERPPQQPNAPPDLRSIAVQILALTKLNWASTDAFCGEPITLKYARDIARLTAAFLRQNDEFLLHPVLERTPWFL